MEIGELMKFKPKPLPKRTGAEGEDEERQDDEVDRRSLAKRRKLDKRREEQERLALLEAEANAIMGGGGQQQISEEMDTLLEKAEGDENSVLDETNLKKLVLNFEKKALKNQELRIKFPDDPQKFLESEVDLHDAIQALRQVSTAPELYPVLVELGCIPSFLGLLSHENTDISVGIVDLIQELTDVDVMNESEEGAEALSVALVDNQVSAQLCQNMERLNTEIREESDGIHNTLAIFENMIEFKPEISKEAADCGLLAWIIKRLKVKVPFDQNKLYASEILSILLQNEPQNRVRYCEIGGSVAMDSLLQQLAYYKRHNPATAEEQEMMENMFDSLCSLLMHVPNREKFLHGEGLQLMNLMLKEKEKASRNGAIKVINHALVGPEGKDNCAKFVEILGLKTIFPLFMKTPKRHKRKGISAEEHEEHVVAIIASLIKNCKGTNKNRVMVKFTEGDHEKVDRIMELHFKYLDKVQEGEQRIQQEELEDEDEIYLRRLELGLFTLQLIDYIIAEICANGAPSIKQRVLKILNQRAESVTTIRHILREYAGNLGDGDEDEVREQERQNILQLVDKF